LFQRRREAERGLGLVANPVEGRLSRIEPAPAEAAGNGEQLLAERLELAEPLEDFPLQPLGCGLGVTDELSTVAWTNSTVSVSVLSRMIAVASASARSSASLVSIASAWLCGLGPRWPSLSHVASCSA
jgi:hypothetical protein